MGEDSRTSVKAREKSKKKASSMKKKRRKYKALDDGKAGNDSVDEVDGVEDELEDTAQDRPAEIAAKDAAEEIPVISSGKSR